MVQRQQHRLSFSLFLSLSLSFSLFFSLSLLLSLIFEISSRATPRR
jgi:hypothetical protein